MQSQRIRDWLAGSFWALPALMVVAFGALAAVLTVGDAALREAGVLFAFAAGPDTARSLLSAIASSTLTLAGLSFSVTLVVLVMASNQYSPRVLRTFLRDRRTKLALGIFLGTYVYALVGLRAVDSGRDGDVFVPGLAVTGAFALALTAIGVFVFFIHHVVQSVRIEYIIGRIAIDTRTALEQLYPADAPAAGAGRVEGLVTVPALDDPPAGGTAPARTVQAPHSGVIAWVHVDGLVTAAADADVTVVVHYGVGQFVPEGATLLTVVGATELDPQTLVGNVALATNRTVHQDVGFGFRQLVDIAERALSPGVNDPTTAVQALDQLHDLLRQLARRPLGGGRHVDAAGVVRLHLPTLSWDDYVELALNEIRHWGAESLQVQERVRVLIDDLLTVVGDDRAEVLHRQRALLDARAETDLSQVERERLGQS